MYYAWIVVVRLCARVKGREDTAPPPGETGGNRPGFHFVLRGRERISVKVSKLVQSGECKRVKKGIYRYKKYVEGGRTNE